MLPLSMTKGIFLVSFFLVTRYKSTACCEYNLWPFSKCFIIIAKESANSHQYAPSLHSRSAIRRDFASPQAGRMDDTRGGSDTSSSWEATSTQLHGSIYQVALVPVCFIRHHRFAVDSVRLEEYEQIFYMDADMLVVKPFPEIWSFPVPLAATRDVRMGKYPLKQDSNQADLSCRLWLVVINKCWFSFIKT